MTGMLWFDNSKASLADKVTRAAEYYQNKYDKIPNCCCVHVNQAAQAPKTVGEIAIVETRQVMPNHFLIGIRSPADISGARGPA